MMNTYNHEREYFTNGNEERAYIVFNERKGIFSVHKNYRTIAEYKTHSGAKRYLTKIGFVAE